MKYFYSNTTKGFYPASMLSEYKKNRSWPDDAIEINEDDYLALITKQSNGKVIVVDDSGYPILSDPPEPTKEKLIATTEELKNNRLINAAKTIAPLQDACDLEMATDAEIKQLMAWKKYRVLLNRIDVNTAPDIDWPNAPE